MKFLYQKKYLKEEKSISGMRKPSNIYLQFLTGGASRSSKTVKPLLASKNSYTWFNYKLYSVEGELSYDVKVLDIRP